MTTTHNTFKNTHNVNKGSFLMLRNGPASSYLTDFVVLLDGFESQTPRARRVTLLVQYIRTHRTLTRTRRAYCKQKEDTFIITDGYIVLFFSLSKELTVFCK